jgi:hypothetical protein
MAEKKETSKNEQYEGHGDSTAPAGDKFKSPGTFVPLSQSPTSADKKDTIGKKGDLNR